MIGIFDKYSEFHQKETCQRQSVNTCKLHTDVLCENYHSSGNNNHIYDDNGYTTCLKHAGPALQGSKGKSRYESNRFNMYNFCGFYDNFYNNSGDETCA